MAYVIVLVLVLGVVVIVTSPWRRASTGAGEDGSSPGPGRQPTFDGETSPERLDLEAARDAKFREIRDAELDHQTGKLSDDDFSAIDSTLRAEAMDLLHKLDAVDD